MGPRLLGIRCYESAGFSGVSADEQLEFNRGQPREYVWLQRDLGEPGPG